jgi:hypothetical protein
MENKTIGEDYTSNEIQREIQQDASESLSDVLALQRQKERSFNPLSYSEKIKRRY